MNRHERRTAAATTRPASDRKDKLALALHVLANAGPTVTGATIIMPDGETLFVSVETARAMRSGNAMGRPS